MKDIMKVNAKLSLGAIFCSLLITLSGCASVAVKSADIEQRTSFALGLATDQFTISDRIDSGVRTDYSVKIRTGETYRCYVTGIISVVGRTVSDAICSKPNGGVISDQSNGGTSCNALLHAAGKC
jgi:hypothetical protein